jgi:hypothetical protein
MNQDPNTYKVKFERAPLTFILEVKVQQEPDGRWSIGDCLYSMEPDPEGKGDMVYSGLMWPDTKYDTAEEAWKSAARGFQRQLDSGEIPGQGGQS